MNTHCLRRLPVLLLTALLLLWAYFFRQKRRRAKRREDRRLPRRSLALDAARGVSEITQFVKQRQEGRRRHHRPRNPTLAETGGLPPVRPDGPPPPTPSS